MKPFTFLSAALVFSMAACTNNDTTSTTETTLTGTDTMAAPVATTVAEPGSSSQVVYTEVPDTVRTVFTAKYPNAKADQVQWMSYAPDTADYWPMDARYYYVVFDYGGENMTSWYNDRGEVLKTTTKVKGDSRLPDAVNKTLNVQYPGYTIEEIEKSNDKDMVMYEIKLEKGDAKAKLKVLPNGEVFKRKS